MKNDNGIFSRENLNNLPAERLDQLLHEELNREPPDGARVRLLLDVIRERDKMPPRELTAEAAAAWERYCTDSESARKTAPARKNRFVRAAAILVMVCMLFAVVPRTVQAGGLFDWLTQWAEDFLQLTSPAEEAPREQDYVFRTEHPGLQQVYDELTALGVTERVVPMWLPGEQELSSIKKVDANNLAYIVAEFADIDSGTLETILQYRIYTQNTPSEYPRDAVESKKYEVNGMEYRIIENDGRWAAVGVTDNIEFCLSVDCEEPDIYRVIDSIYTTDVDGG